MKKLVAAAFLVVGLAACGGGGSSIVPPANSVASPTPAPTAIPIQPGANYVALGDSITYGLYATNYTTESYAADTADALHATLTNLGIPGETSSMLIGNEISKIPVDAQVITLFIGTNDELQVAENGASAASVEASFSANMRRISAILHSQFWNARIYVANLPNLANFPEWKAESASSREALSALNAAMNQAIESMGYSVIDLRCDPRSYDPSNMYGAGLSLGYVHPNTQGHAYYAEDFYSTLTGSLHESRSCSYMNAL